MLDGHLHHGKAKRRRALPDPHLWRGSAAILFGMVGAVKLSLEQVFREWSNLSDRGTLLPITESTSLWRCATVAQDYAGWPTEPLQKAWKDGEQL